MKNTTLEKPEMTPDLASSQQPSANYQNGPQDCPSEHKDSIQSDTAKTDGLGAWLYDTLVPKQVSMQENFKYVSWGSNWTYLAAHLSFGVTTKELGILLFIELRDRKREPIINRLVGALGTRIRDELRQEVARRHSPEPKK